MKKRMCDYCGKTIEGRYIKCCESYMENKIQKLVHVGDLCPHCWKNIDDIVGEKLK